MKKILGGCVIFISVFTEAQKKLNPSNFATSITIEDLMNKKYSNLELDYKYNDPKDKERIYFRSDHYNFAKNGVPIIFYFNGTHNDYHRLTDTSDKIYAI